MVLSVNLKISFDVRFSVQQAGYLAGIFGELIDVVCCLGLQKSGGVGTVNLHQAIVVSSGVKAVINRCAHIKSSFLTGLESKKST